MRNGSKPKSNSNRRSPERWPTGRRCSTWSLRPRRYLRTPRPALHGSLTFSRSPHGTRPSASGEHPDPLSVRSEILLRRGRTAGALPDRQPASRRRRLLRRSTDSRCTLSEREVVLFRREILAARPGPAGSTLDLPHLRDIGRGPRFDFGVELAPNILGGWNDLEDP